MNTLQYCKVLVTTHLRDLLKSANHTPHKLHQLWLIVLVGGVAEAHEDHVSRQTGDASMHVLGSDLQDERL